MSSNSRFLQISPYAEDSGNLIGRDPRKIPAEDWTGVPVLLGLKAIRAKCLECALTPSEVRKCVGTDCPLWHLRMGCVPKGVKKARKKACSPVATTSGGVYHEEDEQREKTSHETDSDVESGE